MWANALLGLVTGAVILLLLQPDVSAAASMSATGAVGNAPPAPLASVVASEHAAAWWTLGPVVFAVIVAVRQPRPGRPPFGDQSAGA